MPRGPLRCCHVAATDMTGSEWQVQYEVQKVAGSEINMRFRLAWVSTRSRKFEATRDPMFLEGDMTCNDWSNTLISTHIVAVKA
ncbi:hypothetical protein Tco_0068184, partial [Tanacetum coccineum]